MDVQSERHYLCFMNWCRISLLLFFILLWNGCSSGEKDYAPEKNFYFSVETPEGHPEAEKIRAYLETNIPKQKYTITNQSGMRWPFYQSFDLDEKVHSDSLMPPHWYLHRMLLKSENSELQFGDFYVRMDIFPQPDTSLNFNVSVFIMQEHDLKMTGTSGIHFIDTALHKAEGQRQFLQESIIRYSFK